MHRRCISMFAFHLVISNLDEFLIRPVMSDLEQACEGSFGVISLVHISDSGTMEF